MLEDLLGAELPKIAPVLLPGVLPVMRSHRLAGQQPDNLCGPYWAAILLQAWGIDIDSSKLAALAETMLPVCDPALCLPPGAVSRQDYSVTLPTTNCLGQAGTSPAGLIQAIETASENRFTAVPLRAQWSPARVEAAIDLCRHHPNAVAIANIRTGHLWGSHLALEDAIGYLNGEAITVPAADWDVGHFVLLAGTATGSRQTLILLGDTYPQFGWNGYHLQPATAIAAALDRSDGNDGGILLVVSREDRASVAEQDRASVAEQDRPAVEQAAISQGFEIAVWNNGTPKR